MAITLNFHGDLPTLLRRQWRNQELVQLPEERVASIKDVVESFGLPHTEVGRLLVDSREVNFDYLIDTSCHIDTWPITAPWDVLQPCILRPHPLSHLHFLVDINVSKLGRLLRMAGFDAASHPDLADQELTAYAEAEGRLVLSKNRALLMRKNIHFGRIIRATAPPEQLHEILNLLNLHDQIQPLSRCLECNALLEEVAKKEINHLLEPLTKQYYHKFSRCPACVKLYWPGSHVEKMLKILAKEST